MVALPRRPSRGRVRVRSRARSRSTTSSATRQALGRCTRVLSRFHWYAGDGGLARRQGGRGDRDPRAARRVGRARPRLQRALAARDARRGVGDDARLGRAGARARDPARRRVHTRARARQHRHRAARARSATIPRRCSRRTRSRTPPAIGTRRRARSAISDSRSCAGRSPSRRCATRSRRSPTREEHEVHTLASYMSHDARVAAAPRRRVGRGRAARAPRDRAGRERSPSCSPGRCSPSSRSAGAIRTPPSSSPSSRPRPTARASCSGSPRCSSWRPSGR